ncbi:MAG: hypothetical protein J1E82_03920 [Muribaculaceae bacterium]|nr:hypothetical protein [Muribaculaceae bacterium]
MKLLSKYILIVATLFTLISFSGCKDDEIEEGRKFPLPQSEAPRIVLEITPISSNSIDLGVEEMIKTLRIIMLTETEVEGVKTEYVEFNQYINFVNQEESTYPGTEPGSIYHPANFFKYYLTRTTVPGIKKFFLIANEESVDEIHFQTENGEPSSNEYEGKSLHEFLNSIKKDYVPNLIYDLENQDEEHGEPTGANVEELLNCLYYTPNFEATVRDGKTEIYLPYTTQYVYNLISKYDEGTVTGDNVRVHVVDETMYLVPCANKFTFKFRNYRSKELKIESLKLSGMASDMYLFAQVDPAEQYKKLGNNNPPLWWVNWLASVSRLSDDYKDAVENEVFNQTYGWIGNFSIPATAFPEENDQEINMEQRKGVIEFVPKDEVWLVDPRSSVAINEASPGEAQTGYYYMPESRYLVKVPITDENGELTGKFRDVERYFLTMVMQDNEIGYLPVTKDTPIGNIGSMFRNNNIIITVTVRDANDVGAYAEPVNWKLNHSFGSVIEEENP